jgi:hypothetical protein
MFPLKAGRALASHRLEQVLAAGAVQAWILGTNVGGHAAPDGAHIFTPLERKMWGGCRQRIGHLGGVGGADEGQGWKGADAQVANAALQRGNLLEN